MSGNKDERTDEVSVSTDPVDHDLDDDMQGIAGFRDGRDGLLDGRLPPSNMPEDEEAFYARDPFSADYAEFLKSKKDLRDEEHRDPRVDDGLRADLLRRPYLMEKPEESTHRGAAAVWRSLKDQLKDESLDIIDRSGAEELMMLKRELTARKMVVESVTKGIDGLIKRADQKLATLPKPDHRELTTPPSSTPGESDMKVQKG